MIAKLTDLLVPEKKQITGTNLFGFLKIMKEQKERWMEGREGGKALCVCECVCNCLEKELKRHTPRIFHYDQWLLLEKETKACGVRRQTEEEDKH